MTAAWMVFSAAALVAVFLLGRRAGIPPRVFWDDPAALTERPFVLGVVTVAGVVLWGVTGTASLMASRFAGERDGGGPARAYRAIGVSALFLMADDQLMLHEDLLPATGIPEPAVFVVYGLIAAALAWRFRRDILALPHVPALVMGLALLGLSTALDGTKPPIPARGSLEESIKFVGLVGLAVFALRSAMSEGRRSVPVDHRSSPTTPTSRADRSSR